MAEHRADAASPAGTPDAAGVSVVSRRPPTAEDRARALEVVETATRAHGEPLGEPQRLALDHPVPAGPIGLLAEDGRVPGGPLAGYGQLLARSNRYWLETVVRPDRSDGPAVLHALVAAALNQVHQLGGGHVTYWLHQPSAAHDQVPLAHRFVLERRLFQMRCPLPVPADARETATARPPRPGAAAVPLRPFQPGMDEDAWLAVNNRAFADHPEQGGWDRATLAAREGESWFDPDGFLVFEEHGAITASCWTKLHHEAGETVGEIYVISVDPAAQGQGLGRTLTVAGLDWLAAHGATTGMLYVDADNEAAVGLYRSLGFEVHKEDRAYVTDVEPD